MGGFGREIPPTTGPLGRPARRTAAVDVATVLSACPTCRFPRTWIIIDIIADGDGKKSCLQAALYDKTGLDQRPFLQGLFLSPIRLSFLHAVK